MLPQDVGVRVQACMCARVKNSAAHIEDTRARRALRPCLQRGAATGRSWPHCGTGRECPCCAVCARGAEAWGGAWPRAGLGCRGRGKWLLVVLLLLRPSVHAASSQRGGQCQRGLHRRHLQHGGR
jgi:hypothetical protein